MITNAHLLAVFKSRDLYLKYIDRVDVGWLTYESENILKALKVWYSEHTTDLDLDAFITYFYTVAQPELPRSKSQEYNLIFKKIDNLTDVDIADVLSQMQNESIAHKLQESLRSGFCKDSLQSILDTHIEDIQTTDEFDTDLCKADVETIVTKTDRSKGLRWRMPCLNKAVGPVIKGDSMLAAGFVGAGKTCFAISEATFMAQQLPPGKRVLWLNNEELEARVVLKLMKSVLNCDAQKIRQNAKAAEAAYIKRMGGDIDKILVYSIKDWSVHKIKRLCEKVKPGLIVIDQVDKVVTTKQKESGADYIRLGSIYAEVREIAKLYAPVLGVSQCDASVKFFDKESSQVQYSRIIDMSQLRGSKVDKPGELDIIITIGQDKTYPTKRYINVAKQKQEGEDSAWMNLQGYEVDFDGNVCRYSDTWKNPA